MCVGIPLQIVTLHSPFTALCRGAYGEETIDLSLVGPQPPGTWLMTFLGAAREVIDANTAAQIQQALDAVAAALGGATDLDAHFADLINREPQLPDFLQPPA